MLSHYAICARLDATAGGTARACAGKRRRSGVGSAMIELVETLVLRGAEANAAGWFRRNLGEGVASSTTRFRAAFAGAGRRLGEREPSIGADDLARLQQAGLVTPERWRLAMFARAALLMRALSTLPADEHPNFVRELYRRGDFREQSAILQSLILLPRPERFVTLAVEACRTNVGDVFEAIACENIYPATHFADLNFNQLVIKAFFVGIAVGRIAGLEARKTPELRRMAADYASERRAAGRSVPGDIDLVLS